MKVVLALAALLVAAPAAQARDAEVRSFDDTSIAVHFFPAKGLKAGERAPTVLIGHGWGFYGDTDPEAGEDEVFGGPGPGTFHNAGYNVLTWDARGFGSSGGNAMVDHPKFEGRDVQAILDFVARQPEAQLDGPGDARVGMAGPSYGGGIQWVTAGIDRRVDAITPTISWNSLVARALPRGSPQARVGGRCSGRCPPPRSRWVRSALRRADGVARPAADRDPRGRRGHRQLHRLAGRLLRGARHRPRDRRRAGADPDRAGHGRHDLLAGRGDGQLRAR